MTVTTYQGWIQDGRPAHPSQPASDLMATLKRHGYTVYWIGNDAHLTAATPEDHTPFSHTPWPGSQPYPNVLAIDVMPGGSMDWRDLGAKLVADKNAGVHGTEPIKYINWTDRSGNCWHDSWEPDHERRPSTDTGHIHISFRTDYVDNSVMAGYDPVSGATPVSNPVPAGPAQLAVDGQLGPLTIRRWQQIMGTTQDGAITQPPGHSELVAAVQRRLNSAINAGLAVDGQGIRQDGRTVFQTTKALQRYLGTTVDGVLSTPVSQCVKALQARLNQGRF